MPLSITFPRFLARRREVTAGAISMFETGRRKPSFETLLLMADALQVDRQLMGRFALESRAPEFYSTLGLAPIEDRDLRSADRRAPFENPFGDDDENEDPEESSWRQRAGDTEWPC